MEDPAKYSLFDHDCDERDPTRMWAAAVRVDIAPIRGSARWPRSWGRLIITTIHQCSSPPGSPIPRTRSPPSGPARPIVVGPNQTAATTTTAAPTELVASGPRWDGSGLAEASRRWSGTDCVDDQGWR